MNLRYIYIVVILLNIFSCNNVLDTSSLSSERKNIYDEYQYSDKLVIITKTYSGSIDSSPIISEDHKFSKELVDLGRELFFEKELSIDKSQNCASCHDLKKYGVDNEKTSLGAKGKRGDRNSPTIYNAALQMAQFWDGRAKDVEEQAGGPILNPLEMAMPNEKEAVNRLRKIEKYRVMFEKVFPVLENPISFENITKAIGAFERTLVLRSRYDDFLEGDVTIFNEQEKRGLTLFTELGCIKCHSGEGVGGNMYQKFTLVGNYWDYTESVSKDTGREKISKKEEDRYVFKVPSLRNVEMTYPYFHDGSVEDLHEVVRIMGLGQLNLKLATKDVDDIVAFLKTLTGKIPE